MKKDNIEDIYGKLKGFEKQPPEELWDNIEAGLQPKKKRRGFLFWIASSAAVLLLFLGYIFYDNSTFNEKSYKKSTTTESGEDKNSIDSKTTQPSEILNLKSNSIAEEQSSTEENSLTDAEETAESAVKTKSISNSKTPKSPFTNKTVKSTKSETLNDNQISSQIAKADTTPDRKKQSIEQKDLFENENNGVAQTRKNTPTENNEGLENIIAKEDTLFKAREKSLKDMALEDSKETKPEKKEGLKLSWLIEVSGGISNTASESVIQNASVQTSAQNDVVYGLKFGYALSDRFTVKTGIGNNILGQKITNLGFASSENAFNADASQNIVNNENIVLLVSGESLQNLNIDVGEFSGLDISQGTFSQRFNYLQIPLEFSYVLFQKENFNIGLGFGGNVNFLTDNNAFINDENIGENLNVNSTLLGASLLTNFSYDLNESLNIFVEPNYNYFQKPVDNVNQDFRNMQFRFLFGIQYKLK